MNDFAENEKGRNTDAPGSPASGNAADPGGAGRNGGRSSRFGGRFSDVLPREAGDPKGEFRRNGLSEPKPVTKDAPQAREPAGEEPPDPEARAEEPAPREPVLREGEKAGGLFGPAAPQKESPEPEKAEPSSPSPLYPELYPDVERQEDAQRHRSFALTLPPKNTRSKTRSWMGGARHRDWYAPNWGGRWTPPPLADLSLTEMGVSLSSRGNLLRRPEMHFLWKDVLGCGRCKSLGLPLLGEGVWFEVRDEYGVRPFVFLTLSASRTRDILNVAFRNGASVDRTPKTMLLLRVSSDVPTVNGTGIPTGTQSGSSADAPADASPDNPKEAEEG